MRAPDESGWSPSSASNTPAFLRLLLYSIIFATASALGTASGAADSYPLGMTIIMKRILPLLIVDSGQIPLVIRVPALVLVGPGLQGPVGCVGADDDAGGHSLCAREREFARQGSIRKET